MSEKTTESQPALNAAHMPREPHQPSLREPIILWTRIFSHFARVKSNPVLCACLLSLPFGCQTLHAINTHRHLSIPRELRNLYSIFLDSYIDLA